MDMWPGDVLPSVLGGFNPPKPGLVYQPVYRDTMECKQQDRRNIIEMRYTMGYCCLHRLTSRCIVIMLKRNIQIQWDMMGLKWNEIWIQMWYNGFCPGKKTKLQWSTNGGFEWVLHICISWLEGCIYHWWWHQSSSLWVIEMESQRFRFNPNFREKWAFTFLSFRHVDHPSCLPSSFFTILITNLPLQNIVKRPNFTGITQARSLALPPRKQS